MHNGTRKMFSEDSEFMTGNKIFECIEDLKLKKTEGYDRIPQRILIDGRESLIDPLASLFALIYRDIWFINLLAMCNTATPIQVMRYKFALCLYKLYNSDYNSIGFPVSILIKY